MPSRFRPLRPALPPVVLVLVFGAFALCVPNYLSAVNLRQLMRDLAEPGLVTLGMAVAVLAGGIDLSVGATFATADLAALFAFQIEGLPASVACAAALLSGALIGAANGLLVAYAGAGPFLTTLATLLVVRAGYNAAANALTAQLADAGGSSAAWDLVGTGTVLGIPVSTVVLAAAAGAVHLFLTRVRAGLHVVAVGSSRRAARHAGIDVRFTLLLAYVLCACCAALAGFLYAARQGSAGSDAGLGMEMTALAALAVGGGGLAGGRGTVAQALTGAATMVLLVGGFLRLNLPGSLTSAVTGLALLAAVALDARWRLARRRVPVAGEDGGRRAAGPAPRLAPRPE